MRYIHYIVTYVHTYNKQGRGRQILASDTIIYIPSTKTKNALHHDFIWHKLGLTNGHMMNLLCTSFRMHATVSRTSFLHVMIPQSGVMKTLSSLQTGLKGNLDYWHRSPPGKERAWGDTEGWMTTWKGHHSVSMNLVTWSELRERWINSTVQCAYGQELLTASVCLTNNTLCRPVTQYAQRGSLNHTAGFHCRHRLQRPWVLTECKT